MSSKHTINLCGGIWIISTVTISRLRTHGIIWGIQNNMSDYLILILFYLYVYTDGFSRIIDPQKGEDVLQHLTTEQLILLNIVTFWRDFQFNLY